jgi:hemin uptake protein HemP
MKLVANIASKTSIEEEPGTGGESELLASMTASPARRLLSETLFGGSNEVTIQHQDDTYVLRLTKQNKLILTK